MLPVLDNCRLLVAIEGYSPTKAHPRNNGNKWQTTHPNNVNEPKEKE